jgi:hypothetical protein
MCIILFYQYNNENDINLKKSISNDTNVKIYIMIILIVNETRISKLKIIKYNIIEHNKNILRTHD